MNKCRMCGKEINYIIKHPMAKDLCNDCFKRMMNNKPDEVSVLPGNDWATETWVKCTTMFSNGTEYEWFIEHYCMKCARYRKGYCRTYRRTEQARWDEKYFPYEDLLDHTRYAGKACKRFTEELPKVERHRKQVEGQVSVDDLLKRKGGDKV